MRMKSYFLVNLKKSVTILLVSLWTLRMLLHSKYLLMDTTKIFAIPLSNMLWSQILLTFVSTQILVLMTSIPPLRPMYSINLKLNIRIDPKLNNNFLRIYLSVNSSPSDQHHDDNESTFLELLSISEMMGSLITCFKTNQTPSSWKKKWGATIQW